MGESMDTLYRLLRKDEYEKADAEEQALNESVNQLYNGFKNDMFAKNAPKRKFKYELELAKEVICECMANLYMSSLVIDEPEKYSESLRNSMRSQCMSIMESAETVDDLHAMFEHSSPYVKGMLNLAESIVDTKTDEDSNEFDGKIVLLPEDRKLIDEFEKAEGKDVYAQELQDRIIDVYKKEQELGEERKEKIQNIVNELSKIESKKDNETNPIGESIELGMGMFSNVPKTIFNSIFINKSKQIMNESGGDGSDLSDNAESILAETICTYTLLECIHSLGFKTYTNEEKEQMRYEFFIG